MTGEIPEFVDHINGNKADNRWVNLRAATKSENMSNTKLRVDNKSSHKCIVWFKNKWQVQIRINGQAYYGGRFKDLNDAIKSADKLRTKLHGDFANNGKNGEQHAA